MGPGLNEDSEIIDLIASMLDLVPKKRISPKEILNHSFLN
jgi:serine/threonine protein kinase